MTELATAEPQPLAYTVKGAARAVGVGETSIRAEIRAGSLEAHYLGSKPLILAADLVLWVQRLPTARPVGRGELEEV